MTHGCLDLPHQQDRRQPSHRRKATARRGHWHLLRLTARTVKTPAPPHLPGVEVQRGELPEVDVAHVDVEGLALVNEGAAVGGHVHQAALLDLPHRLIQRLQVRRDLQVLRGTRQGLAPQKRLGKGPQRAPCQPARLSLSGAQAMQQQSSTCVSMLQASTTRAKAQQMQDAEGSHPGLHFVIDHLMHTVLRCDVRHKDPGLWQPAPGRSH